MHDRPMRYCLITADGSITFDTGTLVHIQGLLDRDSVGETGTEFLNSLHPVTAYYWVPYYEDRRRMNKVANGMYWELSAPVPRADDEDDDREPEEYDPEDRKIKMRGPVAFTNRHDWGLTPDQENTLRQAHETASRRLRARGWL
ncbi:hypothetical protein ACF1AB_39655 [Streptomyces sp. NPDC014846]|uniref:hypothetical protein n=1 Tax=Streptomyces sp. NPDC014846 TaxID=3364922 RepID=UPI0036FEDB0D